MAVYKEPKTNTWRVIYRYTDWNGERKQSQKRGFQTKREAQSWEREQLNKLGSDLDMTFRSFVEHYEEDRRSRIKDSTWESKEHIIRTKLLPYFGKLKMSSITPQQIVKDIKGLLSAGHGDDYKPMERKAAQQVYLEPDSAAFAADPIIKRMTRPELEKSIADTQTLMEQAAKNLDFIQAAQYRDEIVRLQTQLELK